MAKMSIWGMEKYMNDEGLSLFTDLTFPEGIDKTVAVNECLLQSNEFEVLYPDPYFLKEAITHWGQKYALTFAKWVEGFASEFSPIDNYDRKEEWEDHEGNSNKTDYGRKDTTTFGRKDTTTFGKKDTTTNGKTETVTHAKTDTHEVSAYDASTYQPKDKNTEGGTTTTALSGTDSVQASGTDSLQLSGSDSVQLSGSDTITGKVNSNHKGWIHGNVGTTKTTEILSAYLDFYGEYNIYELIADVFCSEFCIMVY